VVPRVTRGHTAHDAPWHTASWAELSPKNVSDVNGPCACSAPGSHVTSAAANATIRARAWRGDAGATVDRAGLAAGRYTSGHSSHPEALHDDRDRFLLLLREHHLLLHLRLHERPLLRQVLLRPLTRLDA
jgi:hypothetical protein